MKSMINKPRFGKMQKRIISAVAAWCTFMSSMPVFALDYGNATVVSGGVTGGTVGNTTTINQSTQAGIINWTSFDMTSAETANFNQPGLNSITLNRVTADMDGTQLAGAINANGSVWVVNPNGVFIQEGASINVGAAFVAAAMSVSDADFLAGNMRFNDANGAGTVENKGSINAGTLVALLGGFVYNDGSIQAAKAVLASAGKSIVLDEVGRGTISLVLDNGDDQDLSEPATVMNRGVIDVSGNSDGSVLMQGTRVGQFGTVHADGLTDGGSIQLLASDAVVLSSDSITTANAGQSGNGGNIWIVGEKTARIGTGASIQARGGSLSGDGGFVETSGYQSFEIGSTPDVGAPAGKGGTWLIDPNNIEIVLVGGAVRISGTNPFISTDDTAQLDVGLILTALNSGNVLVQTANGGGNSQVGNITVSTAVNYSGKTYGLTLDADNNIVFNADVTGGANGLTLIAGGAVSQAGGTSVTAGSLNLNVTGAVTLNNVGNDFTLVSGSASSLTLRDANDLVLNGVSVGSGSGALNLTVGGNLADAGATTAGAVTLAVTGGVTLNEINNDFASVQGSAGSVDLRDVSAINLGTLTVVGSLSVTAGGMITVNSWGSAADLALYGATTINADITTSGNQTYTGAVTLGGGVTRILTGANMDLAGVTGAGMNLTVDASGTTTFGGAVTGVNNLTVDAHGLIDFTAGASIVGNALNLTTTAGGISDSGSGSLTVIAGGGVSTLDAGAANNITLNNVGNNFKTVVITSGHDVILTDVNALILGASTVSGDLTVTAGGAITQQDALSVNGLGTVASFNAGAGNNITLDNVGNNFSTVAIAAGNIVTLRDSGAINIGNSVVANNLTVTAGGKIDFTGTGASTVGGTMNLNSTTGGIDDSGVGGSLAVTGVSTLNATGAGNDIRLDNANNNFSTVVITSGYDVMLNDVNAINIGNATVANNLSVTAIGAITDNAAANLSVQGDAAFTGTSITLADTVTDVLTVAGNANFDGDAGVITIGPAGLVNLGTLTFTTTGAVTIQEDGHTELSGTSTAGSLSLTSTATLTDDPAGASVTVTGNAFFEGTSITLADNADVLSVGGNARFKADTTGITIGAAGTVNFGTLTFTAPTSVTIQEDNATVLSGTSTAGSLSLTSALTITDDATANVTVGSGSFTGTAITLGDQASEVLSVSG
ncbi:MAG: filamentous hemagglutinin N-terminal domain-containing protein, partial [bacterium]